MKSWRTLCLLVACTGFSFASIAQSASPKTLLWRISGKGLKRPSYLFGTIHITDKQIFNLGDSVYRAIEGTDGLAIEINPDEMSAMLINQAIDNMSNAKKVKDILSKDEYKQYEKKLSKKFKKSAAEITTADVVKEKNSWMADYLAKGEMPTFLDAWLFTIGRRSGKWVGGIEDVGDQSGLMEELVDKSDIQYLVESNSGGEEKQGDKGIGLMKKLYLDQDLDGIDAFTEFASSEKKKDIMLIRRNIKMARRMDSLAHIRSMFLAVGAAHLPGDSGVIALLRSRGFTVEPVFSSARIPQENYKIKEVQLPWVSVVDSSGLYEASMPNTPASVKLYGILEMKFLMDISNMSGYCAMATPTGAGLHNRDSIFRAIAAKSLQTDDPGPYTTLKQNGIEGREYTRKQTGSNVRLRLYLSDRNIYMFFIYGMKAELLSSPQADKFFNSVVLKTPAVDESKVYEFIDSSAGLAFRGPAKITRNAKLSRVDTTGWILNAYSGVDFATGSYIGVYSKAVTRGNYIQSDTLIAGEFIRNIANTFRRISLADTVLGGHRATVFTGRSIEQPSLLGRTVQFVSNGHDILVMLVADSLHFYKPALQQVFTSMRTVPHPARQWERFAPDGACFSTVAPTTFESAYPGNSHLHYFQAYDTIAAVTYWVMTDTLGKYYQVPEDSVYWNKRVADWTDNDSLISRKVFSNGHVKGVDVLKRLEKSVDRYKRGLLLLNGNVEYQALAYDDRDALYSGEADRFFQSFRFECANPDTGFLTRPKLPGILEALQSPDSATRTNAYNGLVELVPMKSDRALLEQNLFKQFPPLWTTWSTMITPINRRIAALLKELGDTATISFIRRRYLDAGGNDTLKNTALTTLALLKTDASYKVLGELLRQSPPRRDLNFDFHSYMSDSVQLAVPLFPVLQQFAGDTAQSADIASVALDLVDSNLVTLEAVKKYESDYIRAARGLLPSLRRQDDGGWQLRYLVDMLQRFKSPASNQCLREMLAVKSAWLRERVVIELLKNGQAVDGAVLVPLAADRSMRRQLYDDLKEEKRSGLFPKAYLNQRSFAESTVYDALSGEEDYTIDSLVALGAKTAKYKGKPYVFYLYKVWVDGEDTARLAVAGGYRLGGKDLEEAAKTRLTGIDTKDVFDARKLDAILQQYLRRWEEYEDSETTEEE